MSKVITSYKTNNFKPIIIGFSAIATLCIYKISKIDFFIHSFKLYFYILILLISLFNLAWLSFGRIEISEDSNAIVIQKKLFEITIFRKAIIKPFDVELLDNLKSDYYMGGDIEILRYRFTHKKGIRFINKTSKNIIYEVGINDNINPNKILNRILKSNR